MALSSTTAFILRVDALSEKDVAVALLTREQGVVRAAVRGGRGKGRKAALLQTLNEVAVTLFRREGSALARADSLELVKSSFSLAARPEAAMLLPYLAESLATFLPEAEPAPEAYRLARHLLDAVEAGVDAPVAARYAEVWLLRLSGLMPEAGACTLCHEALVPGAIRLDLDAHGLVCARCAAPGSPRVAPEVVQLLALFRRSPLPEAARQLGGEAAEALAGVEELTRELRRRFLGHELKSYRFLRALG